MIKFIKNKRNVNVVFLNARAVMYMNLYAIICVVCNQGGKGVVEAEVFFTKV